MTPRTLYECDMQMYFCSTDSHIVAVLCMLSCIHFMGIHSGNQSLVFHYFILLISGRDQVL